MQDQPAMNQTPPAAAQRGPSTKARRAWSWKETRRSHPRRGGLRSRLILFNVAVLAFLGVMILAGWVPIYFDLIPLFKEHFNASVRAEGASLSVQLVVPLAANADKEIQDQLKAIHKLDVDIAASSVWSADNTIKASQGKDAHLLFAADLFTHPPDTLISRNVSGENYLLIWLPVSMEGVVLGKMALACHTSRFDTLMRWLNVLVGTTLVVFGLSFLFIVRFANALVAPLYRMMDFARAVAEGKRPGRLQAGGAGELDMLENHLNQMTDTLLSKEEALAKKNLEIKRYTFLISHDLRSPLVNIQGFSGELQKSVADIGPLVTDLLRHLDGKKGQLVRRALEEDIPEALKFIEGSVERMYRSTKAITVLSDLESCKLTFEPIELNQLVQQQLDVLQHEIVRRKVQVTVRSLPEIVADRLSLSIIMNHLLSNAIANLDPKRPGILEIKSDNQGDETVVQVQDNGCGIAAGDLERIFEPFRRMNRQNADSAGMGMGLTYVQALLERHEGRIWCESKPGVGSTFAFAIPSGLVAGPVAVPTNDERPVAM